ncbi:peptidase inhibitor [Streptomyces sp. CAU 1734]|uniref:peptidase inhibitor n=1 Tax=Streptomyces sp. CAU 1734 TaxID=3140360 RepID=UPI00326028CA
MNLRRKIAVLVSTLALSVSGGVLAAPPAAADEPCASTKLCLYRSTLFRTMELSTGSVSNCWWLEDYNLGDSWSGIKSYRNNLGVKATIWYYDFGSTRWEPSARATIGVGGFSSDTTYGNHAFAEAEAVCTGSATPQVYL